MEHYHDQVLVTSLKESNVVIVVYCNTRHQFSFYGLNLLHQHLNWPTKWLTYMLYNCIRSKKALKLCLLFPFARPHPLLFFKTPRKRRPMHPSSASLTSSATSNEHSKQFNGILPRLDSFFHCHIPPPWLFWLLSSRAIANGRWRVDLIGHFANLFPLQIPGLIVPSTALSLQLLLGHDHASDTIASPYRLDLPSGARQSLGCRRAGTATSVLRTQHGLPFIPHDWSV